MSKYITNPVRLGDELNIQSVLSVKTYTLGDCNLFRTKNLMITMHRSPMGEGEHETS